jgi:hypothetical protein
MESWVEFPLAIRAVVGPEGTVGAWRLLMVVAASPFRLELAHGIMVLRIHHMRGIRWSKLDLGSRNHSASKFPKAFCHI